MPGLGTTNKSDWRAARKELRGRQRWLPRIGLLSLVHSGDNLGRLTRYWVWRGLALLVAAVALCGLGISTYLNHVRASATALINSALEIRTKTDAEREIAAWRKRSGKDFWQESDHPGGDHNYDAQIVNLAIAHLHVVEPTGVTVGITMRDGNLRRVTVIESTG